MSRGLAAAMAAWCATVSGCGVAAVTAPGAGHSTPPVDHARAEAQQLMHLVRVPSDATPVGHSPAHGLDQPAQTTATDDIVDLHRWWTDPADAETVLAWLRRHAFPHHRLDGTSTSSGPNGPTVQTLMFSRRAPTGLDSETVLVSVTSVGTGSAIRADAQVVWLPAKPAAEFVDRSVKQIAVSAFVGDRRTGHRVLVGKEAKRLAKVIDEMPTALRGEHGCGADFGYRLHVVAGALVLDEDVACRDVTVTDAGDQLPALAGTDAFVHAVASSMGLPDYPGPPKGKPQPSPG